MTIVHFYNPTPLDPVFIRSVGLSIKDDDAIGQFGTGLKYALAFLLRNGNTVEIVSDGQHYTFSTVEQTIRDRAVEFITCNDENLNIALALGRNWTAKQAFRELLTNAWDEGGDFTFDAAAPEACTIITVRGPSFYNLDLSEIFRSEPWGELFYEGKNMEIYHKTDHLPQTSFGPGDTHEAMRQPNVGRIYYKKMVVGSIASRFDYNLIDESWRSSLTEDRTINDSWVAYKACRAIQDASPHTVINFWKLVQSMDEEVQLRPLPESCYDLFLQEYRRGALVNEKSHQQYAAIIASLPAEPLVANTSQQTMIDDVLALLANAGIRVTHEIAYTEKTHATNVGFVQGDKIFLTPTAFINGKWELAKTILEEHAHAVSGARDYSRAFQEVLLELWATTYRNLIGENHD